MDHLLPIIDKHISQRAVVGNDDAFYIGNIADVRLKYNKWVEQIPRVHPFYAVKCNDDENVLKVLAKLGTGFDCASRKELAQILKLGVESGRIIYAHTAKQRSHLKYAKDNHVEKVTFDSPAELLKIKEIHPQAQVVLRIRFDAENSIICLGVKFGCDPTTEAPALI